MPETRAPGSDRDRTTGPAAQSARDAELAARGLEWKSVPPSDQPVVLPPLDDDLIETFTPARRSSTNIAVIAGAVLAVVVLIGIVYSVVTVSDESSRPDEAPGPSGPASQTSMRSPAPQPTPSMTPELIPTASASPAPSPVPAPPAPALPPVTATAETLTTRAPLPPPLLPPDPGLGVRDRLRELFPNLFPGG